MDEPFIRNGATSEFYSTDALGSSLALTDATGAAQTTYTYEPFGKTTIAGTSSNPFQYTGRENDGTGLYYLRARYYYPRLQRFVSEDPIRLRSGSTNFYAYARNNPGTFVDPLGLNDQNRGNRPRPKAGTPHQVLAAVSPEDAAAACAIFIMFGCYADPEDLGLPPLIPGTIGPGNVQQVGGAKADKIAQDHGFKDAEDFKDYYAPGSASKYNIAVDKGTGDIVLTPVQKGGGPNIPTGLKK